MKKLLTGITVVAFVCIASSAMAAGVKIPKALCLQFNSWADYHCLTLKKNGDIPSANGKVTMYTVNGTASGDGAYLCPVSGTAYIVPGTTTIHASYNGMNHPTDHNNLKNFEVVIDANTGTGTIYLRYEYYDGSRYLNNGTGVTVVDCMNYAIPSSTDAAGNEPFAGE